MLHLVFCMSHAYTCVSFFSLPPPYFTDSEKLRKHKLRLIYTPGQLFCSVCSGLVFSPLFSPALAMAAASGLAVDVSSKRRASQTAEIVEAVQSMLPPEVRRALPQQTLAASLALFLLCFLFSAPIPLIPFSFLFLLRRRSPRSRCRLMS